MSQLAMTRENTKKPIKKQFSSGLWIFFVCSEDKQKAKCKLCSTELSYYGSTINLANHITEKHKLCSTELAYYGSTINLANHITAKHKFDVRDHMNATFV